MTRGKQKSLPTDKPNLIATEVYTGTLSRSYEGESRYSVAEKGKVPCVKYSKKSLSEMQAKYPDANVKQLK